MLPVLLNMRVVGFGSAGFGDACADTYAPLPQGSFWRAHPSIERVVPNIAMDAMVASCRGITAVSDGIIDEITRDRDRLQGLLNNIGGDVAGFVGHLLGPIGSRLYDAASQMISWLMGTASRVRPLLDPSSTWLQREAALSQLDPTYSGSAIYQLFMDPEYQDAADAVSLLAFASFLGWNAGPAFFFNPALMAIQLDNLTLRPTPYLALMRDAVSLLHDRPTGLPLIGRLYQFAHDLCFTFFGAGVSLPTGLSLAVQVIGGLPNPNPAVVGPLIANDPVFRHDLATRLNVFVPEPVTDLVVNKGLPAMATCLQVSDPDSFLRCAEKVVDITLPGLVWNLRRRGANPADARNVVSALWRSGGDIGIAFSQDTNEGRAATGSLLAIGVVGVVCLAELAGERRTTAFFERVFGPIIPGEIFQNLQKMLRFFTLCARVFNDYHGQDLSLTFASPSTRMQGLIDSLNATSWNIADALAVAKARGVFDGIVTFKDGKPLISGNLRALLDLLATWATTEHGLEKVLRLFCELFSAAGIDLAICRTQPAPQPDTGPGPDKKPDETGGGKGGLLLLLLVAAGVASL